ncbi:MAG: hypothetical protein US83_C0006G0014 [Candidatus Falkowbacteria bacterium GW2011_GWC2_38_22]|uniref:Uncharacterized protein n=1 Tax=Candidatus Falkowbacteria bacterium GW2011_GWE1_38_31 TaxID=1618638 RepID=A0A0G0K6U1_9BACT|nr:MAG: hypothetical protein US73_C0001G0077 [Candidatus Falkowbacteria bacterium GW2011_GWF2_38_1205]KKQ61374.1 MAG: hypothetical protein US83_C0006G0014 [Candidatus Falkowbacteria bacterium GW2011_GWC2_38_22]KKQ64044.1 MAG: hypothetical protein US84_C0002G0076 [Candidatus Falkowbacteria bacterium GW2011_GWF1_38_22]KKQ66607.1 MAG: hypothetical protein US87_C0001G0128 [Candidatus Falkowbacteria bacterium GW2011_GWE2_38_254]KKQ71150.1 MAG: hypothetical protein US91_C0001G0077 [Candidatus Falkowb
MNQLKILAHYKIHQKSFPTLSNANPLEVKFNFTQNPRNSGFLCYKYVIRPIDNMYK